VQTNVTGTGPEPVKPAGPTGLHPKPVQPVVRNRKWPVPFGTGRFQTEPAISIEPAGSKPVPTGPTHSPRVGGRNLFFFYFFLKT